MSNYTDPRYAPIRTEADEPNRGGKSIGFAIAALVTLPVTVFIPFGGFLPVILALVGIVLGWRAVRSQHGRHRGTARTGLIVSSVVFMFTLAIAVFWTLLVVNPAVSDYSELHDAVRTMFSR